jgi:hypothetical protein
MFDWINTSRPATLAVFSVAFGVLLAVAASKPAAAQYYPPGTTAQDVLNQGAQQRAYAAAIANNAKRRLDGTLAQSRHFDATVIRGCQFYNGRYYCP